MIQAVLLLRNLFPRQLPYFYHKGKFSGSKISEGKRVAFFQLKAGQTCVSLPFYFTNFANLLSREV